jgi:endo-1,4-beta-xylanase
MGAPEVDMIRRDFIAGLSTAALHWPPSAIPLHEVAAGRGIMFGSEITWPEISSRPDYAQLVARECAIVTPGLEAKWPAVEPAEGVFRFGPLDNIAGFARRNGLRLHMHNLIWAVGLPRWTTQALADGHGSAMMQAHIEVEAGRYRGGVDSWDVINELLDPRWPSAPEGICNTPWRRALGADFVPQALRETRAADPGARLLINDDDLEYDAPDRDRKRGLYVRLIEGWMRQGVPLGGFGLEAHIKPWLPIAETQYRRFLRDLAGFGLKIYVTEFDVCDRELPADVLARDTEVAEITKRYLDMVLDEPAVCTVITWGLYDGATWMLHDAAGRRADGLAPRPLPYDAWLQPKPMRAAMAAAFRSARQR